MEEGNEATASALDLEVARMLDACTQCGDCVRGCPMPDEASIDVSRPRGVMGSLARLLRGEETSDPVGTAERWADVCSGSGCCIDICQEGVNPRFLLAMVRRKKARKRPPAERRAAGRAQFQKMSRGVQVLSRLQLPPPLLEKLSPSSHPKREVPADLVFYTGCNLLKTPHIGLLCLDVLDRLRVSYEVHGGPSSCCGILPMRTGDENNALRQGARTLKRFTDSQAKEVLSWCPTCQM